MLLVSSDDGKNMTGDKNDYCQSGESAWPGGHWPGERAEGGGNRFYGDGILEIMKIG